MRVANKAKEGRGHYRKRMAKRRGKQGHGHNSNCNVGKKCPSQVIRGKEKGSREQGAMVVNKSQGRKRP